MHEQAFRAPEENVCVRARPSAKSGESRNEIVFGIIFNKLKVFHFVMLFGDVAFFIKTFSSSRFSSLMKTTASG